MKASSSTVTALACSLLASSICVAQPTGKAGLGVQSLSESRTQAATKPVSRKGVLQRLVQGNPNAKAPVDSAKPDWDAAKFLEFISYQGEVALVPKGSILHVPEDLKDAVSASATGETIPWLEFISKFPALVELLEITPEQASGVKPIDTRSFAAALKTNRLVIAVIHGNPVSVQQPASPAATN